MISLDTSSSSEEVEHFADLGCRERVTTRENALTMTTVFLIPSLHTVFCLHHNHDNCVSYTISTHSILSSSVS